MLTRRRLLAATGASLGLGLLPSGCQPAWQGTGVDCDDAVLDELSTALLQTEPSASFAWLAGELDAGRSAAELLHVMAAASLRVSTPASLDRELPAAARMTPSVHVLIESSDGDRRALGGLFRVLDSLDRARASSAPLGPLDDDALPPGDEAGAALNEALALFEPEAAQAAIIAISRSEGAGSAFEALLRWGPRNQHLLGHAPLALSQLTRAWARFGGGCGEIFLRHLAWTLALSGPGPALAPFTTTKVRRSELDVDLWEQGAALGLAPLDEAVTDLVIGARSDDADEAITRAVGWLNDGASAQAVYTACALVGVELLLRARSDEVTDAAAGARAGAAGRRCLQTVAALRQLSRRADDVTLRQQLVLTAAAWTARFRADAGLEGAPGVNVLGLMPSVVVPTTDLVFESLDDDPLLAARLTFALLADGDGRSALLRDWTRRGISHRGDDERAQTFLAAAFEEAAVAPGDWGDRLLAGAIVAAPGDGEDRWDRMDEVEQLLGL